MQSRLIRPLVAVALLGSGLAAAAAGPAAAYDPAVTINASGGGGVGDGLRITTGSAQLQVSRVGSNQLFNADLEPSSTVTTYLNNGIYLNIGGTLVGPKVSNDVLGPAQPWTSVTTTGGSASGSGTITTTMTYVTGGRTYSVIHTINYTNPNDYFSNVVSVTVPAGNTQTVRLYHLIDTFLQGADTGPGYALFPGGDTSLKPLQVGTIKTRPTTVVEAFRSASPTWDGWSSQFWTCPFNNVAPSGWCPTDVTTRSAAAGGNLWQGLNGINPSASVDNGIGVTWPVATAAGTTDFNYDLIFTDSSVVAPTLAPATQRVAGEVGKPLATATMTPTNFSGSPTYSVTTALPAGLSINPATGVISGTPAAELLPTTFTIRATFGQEVASATVTLTVDPAPPIPVSIAPEEQKVAGIVGTAIPPTTPFAAFGFTGAVTYTISAGLPSGLSIDPTTGVVSGTPTSQLAAKWFTVTANDGSRTATARIQIAIDPLPPVPVDIAPSVQAVAGIAGTPIDPTFPYDATGFDSDPVYTISPSLPAGLTIDPITGVISGTPSAASAVTEYTVTATQKQQSATATVRITVDPTPPVPLDIAPRVQRLGGVQGVALVLTTPYVTQGFASAPTYAISPALPAGLAIDPDTGVVSGTPTVTAVTRAYTVTATSGSQHAEAVVIITIDAPEPDGVQIVPSRQVRTAVAWTSLAPTSELTAYGFAGPVSYTIAPALPAGLTLNRTNGVVSGTPQTTASGTWTITGTDGIDSDSATLQLTISRKAQVPSPAITLPRSLKDPGCTVIVGKYVRTNAGQIARVQVSAGLVTAGDTPANYRVVRAAGGKVSVCVSGYRDLRIKVVLSAPAVSGYTAYTASRSYVVGAVR